MKRNLKKVLCVALCAVLICGLSTSISGFFEDLANWQVYFDDYKSSDSFEILFSVGADETERNISWYSEKADVSNVILSETQDFAVSEKFKAKSTQTLEGDYTNKVTVTGLEEGKTYYYKCVSGDKESEVRTFSTIEGNDFTAVYMTDIHVGRDEENSEEISSDSFTLNDTLAAAVSNAEIDLILTAGDQCSSGLRSEYQGLSAALGAGDGIPVALTIGNHDRKGIAYKYFSNNPNEYKEAKISSYIGYDYYFVKGDALFLVYDSNCAGMTDHRAFTKKAIEENPDVKWRVAMFHHDLYGGRMPHRESENELLRQIWSPIIDEFAIDLALLGHSHYYTISDVVFNNEAVEQTDNLSQVTDPKGTIFMVSGSINNPRSVKDGETPPLGERVGHDYLTMDPIYNILNFSEDSIEIVSYTTASDEPFNTFKITKTTNEGGHPEDGTDWYDPIIRGVADIYGFFNELFTTLDRVTSKSKYAGQ